MPSRSPNRAYHDRVAGLYDAIYGDDSYWRFWRDVVWKRARAHFPDPPAAVLDAGTGTGHFGLRAARAGYRTTLSDLSPKMCDAARRNAAEVPEARRPSVVPADLSDLAPFGDGAFDVVMAIGDALSFVSDTTRALRAVARVLRPGGVFVATVDAVYGALDHFLEAGDPAALERFLRDGRTEFLAKHEAERFPSRAFTPEQLASACDRAGLTIRQVAPQLALPIRRHRERLDDPVAFRRLLALELKLGERPALLGCGAHLFLAATRA